MDSWFFEFYHIMVFPMYIARMILFIALHLLLMKSIYYSATYFKLVKIKIRKLEDLIANENEDDIKIMLIDIVKTHDTALGYLSKTCMIISLLIKQFSFRFAKKVENGARNFFLIYLLTCSSVICFMSFNITYV